jgi:hypothetical protein
MGDLLRLALNLPPLHHPGVGNPPHTDPTCPGDPIRTIPCTIQDLTTATVGDLRAAVALATGCAKPLLHLSPAGALGGAPPPLGWRAPPHTAPTPAFSTSAGLPLGTLACSMSNLLRWSVWFVTWDVGGTDPCGPCATAACLFLLLATPAYASSPALSPPPHRPCCRQVHRALSL